MNSAHHNFLPHYTYADYIGWEGNWELIFGVPYSMAPSPTYPHQRINSRILGQLMSLLEGCSKCEALMPIDFKVEDDIVLQPDALVLCEPYEKGAFITKTPEMVFEILSPSTREKDLNLKFKIYEQRGVKYYVIIDPDLKLAFVYDLDDAARYKLMSKLGMETFHFEIEFCSIVFDFSKIW